MEMIVEEERCVLRRHQINFVICVARPVHFFCAFFGGGGGGYFSQNQKFSIYFGNDCRN